MRNGQNSKRMRGRNHHRKSQNPMSRVYESNGPDVKIRGNPSHIAEKYIQLARDSQASGDPVSAENYYQHAEHYYRLIAVAQEQFRQNNPHLPRTENEMPGGARDDVYEDGDDDQQQPTVGDAAFGTREPQPQPYMQREQPYLPRDAQPFPQQQQHAPRQSQPVVQEGGDVDRLPSFITGGQQPQGQQPQGQQPQGQQPQPNHQGQNGHDNQPDRFPLHRRRRRHRGGPRQDFQGGSQGGDESPPGE